MEALLTVFLMMGLVTYLPRLFPMAILSRVQLPELAGIWLRLVPAAVLAALLTPQLLLKDGVLLLDLSNVSLVAALPTFAVALWRRNMTLTVVVGVASIVALRALGWS